MAVTRFYDGIPVTFTDEEVKRLEKVFTNPGRMKFEGNAKLPCPFTRVLLDIQKYNDRSLT